MKRHVDEEYEVTKSEILEIVKQKYMESKGNEFDQRTHCGDALGDGKKVKSIGLQSFDVCFRENHGIYL